MFRSFRYSVKQAFVQTWRNKNMSIASIFSITAMLLILGLFFIIAINVNVMIDDAKKDFDTIEACLKDEVTVEQGQLMAEQMNADIDVKKAYYQTKDEALKNWREKKWGDNGYLLDGLNPNPLPNSVMIKVSDISKADSVVEKLSQYEGIEKIKYYKEVVDRLLKFSKNVQIGAFVLIAFLILVSIVCLISQILDLFLVFILSTKTSPSPATSRAFIHLARVDFPEPFLPMMAVKLPSAIERLMSLIAIFSSPFSFGGYLNIKFSILIMSVIRIYFRYLILFYLIPSDVFSSFLN